MVEIKPLKCPNCGANLELNELYDREGGFDEGYYSENGHYICNQCDKKYFAERIADLTNFRYDNIKENDN